MAYRIKPGFSNATIVDMNNLNLILRIANEITEQISEVVSWEWMMEEILFNCEKLEQKGNFGYYPNPVPGY